MWIIVFIGISPEIINQQDIDWNQLAITVLEAPEDSLPNFLEENPHIHAAIEKIIQEHHISNLPWNWTTRQQFELSWARTYWIRQKSTPKIPNDFPSKQDAINEYQYWEEAVISLTAANKYWKNDPWLGEKWKGYLTYAKKHHDWWYQAINVNTYKGLSAREVYALMPKYEDIR